ncbi:MAG: fructose-bisphosphatase class III [Peptoniphilus sp.]|nr:fructose-bisphosphatase class III [Peptoniphilus sp.]MDY3118969.1 fructose-bisphosphatase class III [Peptoniphilus sp.]
MDQLSQLQKKYYRLLANKYPSKDCALAEALLLESGLNLPKPTEHFVSDLHGEYRAFTHVLRNASGVLKRYIDELFPEKPPEDRRRLATILYYPEEKLRLLKENRTPEAYNALLKETLADFIVVAKRVAAKYDHDQIEATFPADRKKVLNLLLLEEASLRHKQGYVETLHEKIVAYGEGERYIRDLADLSVRYAVENLHVLGDIYDRGEEAEKIMDLLMACPKVDIQWGNHDIAWIGACTGNFALAANVIRIAVRYNVLHTIEDGYGINLLPLVRYAENYRPTAPFYPKNPDPNPAQNERLAKLHKAISILQFKAEGQLIAAHPEFGMDSMRLLHCMDLENRTVNVGGQTYPLLDGDFPTVDPADPYAYTAEEREVVKRLTESFTSGERLRKHIRFLIESGSMYLILNDNLLFHGCLPTDKKGDFLPTDVLGAPLSGRALLDAFDRVVRDSFFARGNKQKLASDRLFYLWCGKNSPLFGKERITTFERYFIDDKATHVEEKNPYYRLREDEAFAEKILHSFAIDPSRGKIINGHTPVKRSKGENPVKAAGKVIVIDGGFAHAYRKTTGTAGYTLISNSYGILLATHSAAGDEEKLLTNDIDITSSLAFVTEYDRRRLVRDTDGGKDALSAIEELITLAKLYETGEIPTQK